MEPRVSFLGTIPLSRWGKPEFCRALGAEGTPTPVVVLDKVEKDLSDGWKLGIFQPKGAAQVYWGRDSRQTAEMVAIQVFPDVFHIPTDYVVEQSSGNLHPIHHST